MISSDRMAAIDRNAAALGVPRKQLMESSGNAIARAVRDATGPPASVAILAGRGNNGGDGFVAARFLEEYAVRTHLLGHPERIRTEIARENWAALEQGEFETVVHRDSSSIALESPDIVVDAMLGTGASGAPREPVASAVEAVNQSGATVIAVDMPTGRNADTGDSPGVAVDADRIVTFHERKPAHDSFNNVSVADIGIPQAATTLVGPGDLEQFRRSRPPGEGGRVFVIGGGPYTGAPALCAQAALRAGAELAFVAAPETVADEIQGYSEDLIVQPYSGERLTPDQIEGFLNTAHDYDDVVVLGPGLGRAEETNAAAAQFLESFEGRVVVDADGLAVVPDVDTDASVICTPNSEELVALGGPRSVDLEADREAVTLLADELDHVVLAKGAVDVISDGTQTRRARAGSPGMSVGGTGDVLAGVIAGLLGSADCFDAACLAAYATGRAGEEVAETHASGLLASDLLETLPTAVFGAEP